MTKIADKMDAHERVVSNWQDVDAWTALDILSNPIMISDTDLVVRFVNKAATKMFAAIEDDIRQDLPHFRADDVLDKSIDQFHKNPGHQRGMLAHLSRPYDGGFTIGGKHLSFRATPQMGTDGKPIAFFVEWKDNTELVETQRQTELLIEGVVKMASAHKNDQITARISEDGMDEQYAGIARDVNSMINEHIETKKTIITAMRAFARGDFAHDFPVFGGERAFITDAVEEARKVFLEVVDEIEELSQAIVDGQLDKIIECDRYEGGFKRIVEALDRAYDGLNSTIRGISEEVGQVSKTITQISESATQLATNAQMQSSAVEEISATTEETDAMVRSNADASKSTSEVVTAARAVSLEGQNKVTEMVEAMQDIRSASDDISKIIKVIDEIAFQTNLLALNAAVEAARAGEHGRGFAVVAQEVRNLAGRSAQAAKETSELIDSAGRKVRMGVELADQTKESFSSIGADIARIDDLTNTISVGSAEQSRGVSQISEAVNELTRSSLGVTSQSDQLAAAATQMSSACKSVQSAMSRFQLRETRKPAGNPTDMLKNLSPDRLRELEAFLMRGQDSPAKPAARAGGNRDMDPRGFGSF